MKITILDGATLGKDVKLDVIKKFGTVTFYETTKRNETVERIANADVIITNKVIIDYPEFEAAKNLKLICVAATGYNNINVCLAKKYNTVVCNVKAYSTESVAQHVFAYILAFSNSIIPFHNYIKSNYWQNSQIFTCLDFPFFELKGKNLGIIGYGTIGKRVAEIAKAFGMNILISKRKNDTSENNERLNFVDVLKESDFLTIHCPLNQDTENLITIEELKMMKKSAFLLNIARGGIVNEQDLYIALNQNIISGAAVDVLTKEPPKDGNILFNAPNIFITPHIAWTSKEARQKLVDGIAKNIQFFIDGRISDINLWI